MLNEKQEEILEYRNQLVDTATYNLMLIRDEDFDEKENITLIEVSIQILRKSLEVSKSLS